MNEPYMNRPHWSFWIIVGVLMIFNIMGCINFTMQLNPDFVASMPEAHRAIIEARPVWATAAFAVAVFGGVLGCLLLLLRKSVSYYVFILALIGPLVTMIDALKLSGSTAAPVEFLIGNLSQLAVAAFLLWYSKLAGRKGWTI